MNIYRGEEELRLQMELRLLIGCLQDKEIILDYLDGSVKSQGFFECVRVKQKSQCQSQETNCTVDLKVMEGATSQTMQATSASCTRQGNRFSNRASRMRAVLLPCLNFSTVHLI